jgi:hypothetical protein
MLSPVDCIRMGPSSVCCEEALVGEVWKEREVVKSSVVCMGV